MSLNDFEISRGLPEDLPRLRQIDDEASALFAEAGLSLSLPPTHPFVLAEAERWGRSLASGDTHVARVSGEVVGFASLELVDGAPYLEQLSVTPRFMRRGLGRALLAAAVQWSAGRPLWLTTYEHLAWNAPFYERMGFVRVPERAVGPGLSATLASQRAVLPAPERRVVMVRK